MLLKEMWTEAPRVDLEGSNQMRFENYVSILEFSDQRLRLRMKEVVYELQGTHLMIRGVTKREIFVEGEFQSLQIIKEETP